MVSQKIKSYLEEKGIKQNHVAAAIGVSKQTLNAALAGKRRISAEEYIDICKALDVPLETFSG